MTGRVTVRFAPSPTGLLHVGNARIALLNWLFAKARAGAFVLRFDDTDRARCEPRFADAIERDLRWLGLGWDRLARQSDRMAAYEAAAEKLKRAGRLYACYEAPEELEAKRRRALLAKRPPIYDRAALALTEAERRAHEAAGRKPHWRFRLDDRDVRWDDLVRGPAHLPGGSLSDPVLVRADGTFLYMLPSTVDDAELAVTHVIRGEDHVDNTAVQIRLFEALGAPVPAFAHLPLLVDAAGAKLSKRIASSSLESLRGDGIEPMAVNGLLARLGTPDPVEPVLDLDALVDGFDVSRFGRAQPKFDLAELEALNAKLLHRMPYERVAGRLTELGLGCADARFWEAVRPNVQRLADAGLWHGVCFSTLTPVVEDEGLAGEAAKALPPEPWGAGTWDEWTGALAARTGRRGKALYGPLRLALTGRDHGPELRALLPLIGRKRALARLLGEAA
jgi:glutamyl-tRNA synthetase